jgi:hypothetical protein
MSARKSETATTTETEIAESGIERRQTPLGDLYIGTKAKLLAAGLVPADKLPTHGRIVSTYVNGELVRTPGGVLRNENYMQVRRFWPDGEVEPLYRLTVGIPVATARERKAAARAERDAVVRAEAKAKSAKAAAEARECLVCIPRTADAFRRGMVRDVRDMVRAVVVRWPELSQHGYSLSADSLETVLCSIDAVVEAIMSSDVVLDHAAHLAKVNPYQAAIAANVPDVSAKLALILVPNAAVLVDEGLT